MNVCLSLPATFTSLPSKSSWPRLSSSPQSLTKHPNFELLKNRLIRLADDGHLGHAVSTLDFMQQQGIPPDLLTYSVLLKSCIRTRHFDHGKRIHARLLESSIELDTVVLNTLITLYSKCGDLEKANEIFKEMGNKRGLVSWSAMISGYTRNGKEFVAITAFYDMLESGEYPNQYCYSSVIQACSNKKYAWIGKVIFGSTLKTGYFGSDVCVGCALIDMFAKIDDMVSSRKVFNEMPERNAVTWTLMITRYAQYGFAEAAINLYFDMELNGFSPDVFSLSGVISAATALESLHVGKYLHSRAIKARLASDICVGCCLVDLYAKCEGSIDDAGKVFDRMPQHNVMSWTAMITGYVLSGRDKEAIKLFLDMNEGSVCPNHFTFSSLLKACANLSDVNMGVQIYAHVVKLGLAAVNFVGNSFVGMYARSGRMEEARKAFDLLLEKSLVSYDVLVDGYIKNLRSDEAFGVFHQIQNESAGISAFTFASLLSAAASISALGKGQQLHARILKTSLELDRGVSNSLISMYSRCGAIDDACQVFNNMDDRNVISWTSMITGFAKHGYARRALDLFSEMVASETKPNDVTYIAVLSACSHVGMVAEGWNHFNSMHRVHGITPKMEHYACMVDLLGRSGFLKEAHEFVAAMPYEADALVWRTLLGACRVHGDMNLGEIAAKRILELDNLDPSAYVLLSNLYASRNQWDEVAKIRKTMKERQLTKEGGSSWIEVNNVVHKFYVGDTSHPRAKEIFLKLDEMAFEIKSMGYVPDKNFILYEVEEEQKEQYLFQHSEKIAVAFGLISSSLSGPIRIFNNLRVCGDCHNAIKFISVASGREIVIRDSNRFHHIKNGICSCGDYW
ncbi:pentatricopeptide repeat-containing protein At3g49170, chloroplastic [Aristolochia californica]|uniref:pentatricopeptide repeat-containing protein At3g49170, chloroplastic n=1 Tax=Aristolochia californica TaxID=171875 RepID=UPI0035D77758